MQTEINDFKDRSNQIVSILLNGKKYRLKRYTMAQEIALKNLFEGNLESWQKGLNGLDGETLIKSLWCFLEDKTEFTNWVKLAEQISGDLSEKMNILESLSTCITAGMPDVQEAVKKRAAIAKKQALTLLRGSLTGPGSTIPSPKNMGGQGQKSKTAPTTK